jgi:phosphatidylglycerophosphate synthase
MSAIHKLNLQSQRLRARIFRPFLELLTRLRVTGNVITNLRLVGAFVFLGWFYVNPHSAVIFLIILLFLDTLDGALARYQDKASDRGKFIDVIVDRLIYNFVILALFLDGAPGFLAAYNIMIIDAAYLLATVKKNEGEPSDWIIKTYPRMSYLSALVVIPFFLKFLFAVDYIDIALVVTNTLATVHALFYFIYIQYRWMKK